MANNPIWSPEEELAFARIAFGQVNDGIAIISDGRMIFVNKAWMDIFKVTDIAQALESPLDKYVIDEDKELLKNLSRNTEDNQEPITLRIVRPDGDPRVIEGYVRPFTYHGNGGAITFIRDVTVRKMAEAQVARHAKDLIEALNELRESEERFRILVENIKDYSICLLDAEGNVTSWNKSGELLEGYKKDEVVGKYCSIFFSQADIAKGRPQMILSLTEKNGIYHERGVRTKKGGAEFVGDVTISALHNRDGKLIGFSRIVREVIQSNQG